MSGLFAWLFGKARSGRGASVKVVERAGAATPSERPAGARTSDAQLWPDSPSEAPSAARPVEPTSSGAAAAAAAGGALAIAAGVAHADKVEHARASDDDAPDGAEPSLDTPDGPAESATSDGDGGSDGGGSDGGDGGDRGDGGGD